jgi:hypothetical protein
MIFGARIGAIEIDGDEVRIAVVESGGRPVIHEMHAARAVYDSPDARHEAMVTAVRAVLGKIKSKPSLYVLVAQSQFSLARHVQVPFKGARRVAAAVPIELEPYLAIPIEEMLIDYSTVRERDSGTEVLALCLRFTAIEEQLSIVKDAGVDADCVNVDVAGLTALWQTQHRDANGYDAVVHVRDAASMLVIVQKKSLMFFRSLPMGASDISVNALPLIREIQNSIRGFRANSGIEGNVRGLYITGVTMDDESCKAMEERIGAPVVQEDLLAKLKGTDKALARLATEQGPTQSSEQSVLDQMEAPARTPITTPGSAYAALVGCAVSMGSGAYSYDFRKGQLAKPSEVKALVLRGAFSISMLLILGIGYVTYCYVTYQRNQARISEITREMWGLYLDTFPKDKNAVGKDKEHPENWRNTADMIESASSDIGATDDALLQAYSKPTLLDILLEVSKAFPKGSVTFSNVRMQGIRDSEIDVSGKISDGAGFSTGIEALKASQVATLEAEPTRRNVQGEQTFDMKLTR